jgi:hypothetical protein
MQLCLYSLNPARAAPFLSQTLHYGPIDFVYLLSIVRGQCHLHLKSHAPVGCSIESYGIAVGVKCSHDRCDFLLSFFKPDIGNYFDKISFHFCLNFSRTSSGVRSGLRFSISATFFALFRTASHFDFDQKGIGRTSKHEYELLIQVSSHSFNKSLNAISLSKEFRPAVTG